LIGASVFAIGMVSYIILDLLVGVLPPVVTGARDSNSSADKAIAPNHKITLVLGSAHASGLNQTAGIRDSRSEAAKPVLGGAEANDVLGQQNGIQVNSQCLPYRAAQAKPRSCIAASFGEQFGGETPDFSAALGGSQENGRAPIGPFHPIQSFPAKAAEIF
jgi:hypothetical protein